MGSGESNCGEKFVSVLRATERSCSAYGECRCLSIRGLCNPLLVMHFDFAARASKALNHRRRFLGRAGGKGPGLGLGAAHQLYICGEGKTSVWLSVFCCSLMHQPAHRIMRQHPAIELLPHQVGFFAAQYASLLQQVRLEFIKNRLHFPALVIERR